MAIKRIPSGELDLLGPRERGFTFPLPTVVEGQTLQGKDFQESTVLSFISDQGSTFYLRNTVKIGTRLRLVVDLPEKLASDRDLKLVIKGRVVQLDYLRSGNPGQKVTVRFDSRYIIRPEEART